MRSRARKRAIRAQAAQAGVPYSVAARQLDEHQMGPGETLAAYGRTVYPAGADGRRDQLVAARDARSFGERVHDARLAAALPDGRARHLAERFPPTRGLYDGPSRVAALAQLYMVAAHERPEVVPAVGDLAWIAELGEETALDIACAGLDRAARRVLDQGAARLAARVRAAGATTFPGYAGARQTLDALLVVGDDGHAPGTLVRGAMGTGMIVGACWGLSGPPVEYDVRPDDGGPVVLVDPYELVVLAGQDPLLR